MLTSYKFEVPVFARQTAWVLAIATLILAAPADARPAPESFSGLAKQLLPAVVNISTKQSAENVVPPGVVPESPPTMPGPPGLPPDLFGGGPGGASPEGQAGPQPLNALGSGFIIDPDGYVVTNSHLVAEAKEIMVKLADGRSLRARVVGSDPATDLALLKIEAGAPLPYVRWGASGKAEIGDWVVAIGNPFGLGSTLTAGVLSARARDIHAGPYDDFLQTDAAINTGNSGGPLFDMDGTVIGVNTAILSPTGGSIGIGFAIPASTAKPIIDELRKNGVVRRGWLGVQIQPVTEDVAKAVGLEKPRGALVSDVAPNGPGAKAGLKPGDVILSFDNRAVGEIRALPRMVANADIGKTVDIEVWRDGSERSLEATVVLQDPAKMAAMEPGREMPDETEERHTPALGATLAPLDDSIRRELGLDEKVRGAVVTEVTEDGASHGLLPGDVIVEVAKQPVSSPEQVVEKIDKVRQEGADSALLRIVRDGTYRFAAVPV